MRVLLSKRGNHHADRICVTTKEAKRVLNECMVTDLLIEYGTPGRETGLDVLKWAAAKQRLPQRVIIIEANISACQVMGDFLSRHGYRTTDQRQYMKFH